MTQSLPSKTVVHVDVTTNSVSITAETSVYDQAAVLGAAYVFIDRCFVLLDAPNDESLRVSLRGRSPLDDTKLEELAGEFGNELLGQTLRRMLAKQNAGLLEAIAGRAIAGAVGPAAEPEFDLSELEALDLDDEHFEDPLGIAMSWEEKYGNKRASKKDASEQKAALAAATNSAEGE